MEHPSTPTTNTSSHEAALLLTLANRHLRPSPPLTSPSQLSITDTSGMSNATYIVSCPTTSSDQQKQQIVIRLFKSKASDFEIEAKVFKIMGEKGLGPLEIESTEQYRVEECIDGRPLTFIEMRNPEIGEQLMVKLCELNYDQGLKKVMKEHKYKDREEGNHSIDFINDHDKGWLPRYLREVRPILLDSRHIKEHARANHIFNYFERLTSNYEVFNKEYTELLSAW